MAKYKVLYTDTGMQDISIEEEVLASADIGLSVSSGTDEETLIAEGINCHGIMVEYANITAKVLDAWGRGGRVKVVARQGIGFNNIDLMAATRNNIMVANVPDYCLDEVADHTMALALNVLREIKAFGMRMEQGDFEEHPIRPIHRFRGRKFCVFGFGNIAERVAARAQSFGFITYAYDPYISELDMSRTNTKKAGSIDELAAIADVLSLHAPLLESTKHVINRKILNLMKKEAVIINTARGGLINESDLIEALETNRIAGAGLDVFEKEPPDPSNPLIKMSNAVVTPHISWCSREAEKELRTKIAENIKLALTEGEPRNFVNKDAFVNITKE